MSEVGELLEPIAKQLRKEIIGSDAIFTDDTPVTIAQGSDGGSRKGRVWVYLDRDGRHFYDFTESRKRDGPLAVIGDYDGFIHADAYAGYDEVFLPGGATEVACRVDEDVAALAPHRSGRAGFPHPVPRATGSLAA